MTKQRMAGYTPLRIKSGAQTDVPVSAEEEISAPLVNTPATPAQAAPQIVEPAPALKPVQEQQLAAQADEPAIASAVPVVATHAESVPTAGAGEVPATHSDSPRQRMAGYTPLRAREGATASAAAAASVAPTASTGASENTVAAPASSVAEPAPKVDAAPKAPESAQSTSVAAASEGVVPANRMQGYTALRAREPAQQATPAVPVAPQQAEPVTPVVAKAPPVAATPPASTEKPALAEQPVPAPAPELPSEPAPAAKAPTAAATPADSAASTIKMKPWVKPALFILGAVVAALLMVLAARGLRLLGPVQDFITTYDGHSTMPDSAPTGIPGWLGWQHFLNMFFIVLIIRTGLQVRHEKRPAAMWTPKPNSWFSPKGNTPKKYSLSIWTHQALDALWVLNGVFFVILLAITGQWMRVVPTNWDIFPNLISGALQYASLDWPVENGWIHYNALQMLSYFLVIYVAAPLAILTGVRMSSWWPTAPKALNKYYPIEVARKIHFPVMLFFAGFVLVHVFLVLTTGVLKNLNYMYSSRDASDAWGLVIFLVSVAVVAAGWIFLKPMFLLPAASATGKISKN